MAAIWKGHISFGLVHIPISLHTAENREQLTFHFVDRRNGARVKNKRVNESTGKEVSWNDVVKAFEIEKDRYVLLEKEDFDRIAVEATHSIEIERFVEEGAIDYIYFEKPYYVIPGKGAERGFVLLREALKREKKIGVAKVVIGSRQHLGALIPMESALVLEILRYQYELKDMKEFAFPTEDLPSYKISDRELDLAIMLVENLTGEWDPELYKDEYHDALLAFIEKKVQGDVTSVAPTERELKGESKVIDMMELLKKSVQQSSKCPRKSENKRRTSKIASRKKAAS